MGMLLVPPLVLHPKVLYKIRKSTSGLIVLVLVLILVLVIDEGGRGLLRGCDSCCLVCGVLQIDIDEQSVKFLELRVQLTSSRKSLLVRDGYISE